MRTKKSKQLFKIELEYDDDTIRIVNIRATTREIAEKRAMKFNPGAKGVKHNA